MNSIIKNVLPSNVPPDAFCLKPKVNPKSDDCWYDGKGTIF